MNDTVLKTDDTIAAIATGLTNAGISIIRISGPESFAIASKIFRKKKEGSLLSFDAEGALSHTVHYGFITEQDSDEKESVIDEVMLLILKAPNTFTREDTVEIDCHGGIMVTKKVLEAVLNAGARIAEPGEFTKRAFLNGRIDLSQAEAVAGIINAKNSMALGNMIKQLGGVELNSITELRESIIKDTAYIEAALDDPEHIELDGFSEELREHLLSACAVLRKMINSADNGRLISEGINTVILGKPNAGKSTLLNAMMGEERAIVTEIAGTTRDTLEESISFEGISLNIIDTAGIRDTDDKIEKIGVDRALSAADSADLVLFVLDATEKISEDDRKIAEKIKNKKIIVLVNKSDLWDDSDVEKADALHTEILGMFENCEKPEFLSISAKQGLGLETLGKTIKEMFFSGKILPNDEIYITSLRHKECLTGALSSLEAVLDSIDAGMSEDFYTIDLMSAYSLLGQIIGEDTDEDLIDKIFKDFCMGK